VVRLFLENSTACFVVDAKNLVSWGAGWPFWLVGVLWVLGLLG
jgi:hypothetical protein